MRCAPDQNHARRQRLAHACVLAYRDHTGAVPLGVWCALHTGAWCSRLTAGESFAFMAAVAYVRESQQHCRRTVLV